MNQTEHSDQPNRVYVPTPLTTHPLSLIPFYIPVINIQTLIIEESLPKLAIKIEAILINDSQCP